MNAYMYITLSLILYPVIGYFVIRLTKSRQQSQKTILVSLIILSFFITLGLLSHTITISQNLNWFLLTSIYLTVSVILWRTHFSNNKTAKAAGKIVMIISFGVGYMAATFGFFFVMLASNELDVEQRLWLTNNLIYTERNIGQGPDPSVRLKEVQVYERVNWLPLLATRVKAKVYDDWDGLLGKKLNVSYSQAEEGLYLSGGIKANKKIPWSDTIFLKDEHHR